MTISKKLLLASALTTALFSTLTQCGNPLLTIADKKCPVTAKRETLLGIALTGIGNSFAIKGKQLTHIGSQTLGLLLKLPGRGLMLSGILCIGHSVNETYKFIKM